MALSFGCSLLGGNSSVICSFWPSSLFGRLLSSLYSDCSVSISLIYYGLAVKGAPSCGFCLLRIMYQSSSSFFSSKLSSSRFLRWIILASLMKRGEK